MSVTLTRAASPSLHLVRRHRLRCLCFSHKPPRQLPNVQEQKHHRFQQAFNIYESKNTASSEAATPQRACACDRTTVREKSLPGAAVDTCSSPNCSGKLSPRIGQPLGTQGTSRESVHSENPLAAPNLDSLRKLIVPYKMLQHWAQTTWERSHLVTRPGGPLRTASRPGIAVMQHPATGHTTS